LTAANLSEFLLPLGRSTNRNRRLISQHPNRHHHRRPEVRTKKKKKKKKGWADLLEDVFDDVLDL
jgi:hypothetical protein